MTGWAWALPRDPSSPGYARRIVNDALAAWGVALNSDAADNIRLAVSEGVTNGVTHGTDGVEMTLDYDGRAVTCEIRSHGKWIPSLAVAADPESEHGRGLLIIEAVGEILKREAGADGAVIVFRVPLTALPVATGLAA